jgi:xanthosine utilization system XapX-like protein
MSTFLIIIAAILVVGLLSYLIVNKVPKNLRPIISIILWVLIIFLGYKIYQSIMGPIEFNKEKKIRYALVVENLKTIRDAQVAHKEVTGNFTDKPADLISFIDTARFAITETKNIVITEQRGSITVDVEKRVTDTIGFKDVRASFAGRDYKNMFKVPNTDAQFEIKTGWVEKVQGVKAPVFLARVDKAIVLEGLNKDLMRMEKESLGGSEVSGEYISVGSLENVNTSGNWPPSYDPEGEKDKDK